MTNDRVGMNEAVIIDNLNGVREMSKECLTGLECIEDIAVGVNNQNPLVADIGTENPSIIENIKAIRPEPVLLFFHG